jgi:uncharacterized sodium:solute symporter family permease YidK
MDASRTCPGFYKIENSQAKFILTGSILAYENFIFYIKEAVQFVTVLDCFFVLNLLDFESKSRKAAREFASNVVS